MTILLLAFLAIVPKPVCLDDVNKVPKGALITMTKDKSCKSGLVWAAPKAKK